MNSTIKCIVLGIVLFLTLFIIHTQIEKSKIYYDKYDQVYQEQIKLIDILNQSVITMDSLQCTIDSLTSRYLELEEQMKRHDVTDMDLINAIIHIESRGNDNAYNADEDAVGCLQIRQCMVDDINRILTRRDSPIKYTYEDRWDRGKSIAMFNIFVDYYNLTSFEEIARCWNGGPRGINNPYTVGYWSKVETKLEEGYASR